MDYTTLIVLYRTHTGMVSRSCHLTHIFFSMTVLFISRKMNFGQASYKSCMNLSAGCPFKFESVKHLSPLWEQYFIAKM